MVSGPGIVKKSDVSWIKAVPQSGHPAFHTGQRCEQFVFEVGGVLTNGAGSSVDSAVVDVLQRG